MKICNVFLCLDFCAIQDFGPQILCKSKLWCIDFFANKDFACLNFWAKQDFGV